MKGLQASSPIPDVPDAPVIGTATNVGTSRAFNNGSATITYTAASTGGTPASYTITSNPGSFTGTGASPVTITGLQSNTAYTFSGTATNTTGTSSVGTASSSIIATTVPAAPTIGTATKTGITTATVAFTEGATGGSTITTFTVTSSPGSITGTGASSPISMTGLTGSTAYTFTVTATNANGTSTASSASNSITTDTPTYNIGTWSLSTAYPLTAAGIEGRGNGNYLVGAGGFNSPNILAQSYSWNGSAWSSSTPLGTATYRGGLSAQQDGSFSYLQGYISGGETAQAFHKSSATSAWSATTSLPVANYDGGAAGYGASGMLIAGGSSAASSYYRASSANAWISGASYPSGGYSIGTNNSDWSKAYLADIDGYGFYSTINGTASYTTETNSPNSTQIKRGSALAAYSGSLYLLNVRDGLTNTTLAYRYTGSAWTSQTTIPVRRTGVGGTLGVQGGYISFWGNAQDGANSNAHYRALLE